MKTIFKNGSYDRVGEEIAESNGWKYVPKSEWKLSTRSAVSTEQLVQAEKKEKTLSKKAERRSKFKTNV